MVSNTALNFPKSEIDRRTDRRQLCETIQIISRKVTSDRITSLMSLWQNGLFAQTLRYAQNFI